MPKKTFQCAAETGNFLITQVKGNQPNLLAAVTALCTEHSPTTQATTDDPIRHGRQEHRRVEVFEADHRLGAEWDGLIVAIARVTRRTWHKDTKSVNWFLTEETSYYASQIALPADVIGPAIREHWGIENRNHHVRDVSLGEDASRIWTKPGRFARLRSFALNILRANGVTNIRQATYENALNFNNILSYRVI